MDWFVTVQEFIGEWVPIVLAIIGGFAVLATKTPNKVDDRILQVILDVVNFLGANIGKAKNDPSV